MDEELLEILYMGVWILIGGLLSIIALEIIWEMLQMNIRLILYNTFMSIIDTFEFVGTTTLSPEGQERMNPLYTRYRNLINAAFWIGEALPGGICGFKLNRKHSSRN